MKLLLVASLALIAICCIAAAADDKPPARPAGVEESRWTRITDTFGFVLTKDVPTAFLKDPVTGERIKRVVSPRVSGYFVILRENTWCRVDLDPSNPSVTPLFTH